MDRLNIDDDDRPAPIEIELPCRVLTALEDSLTGLERLVERHHGRHTVLLFSAKNRKVTFTCENELTRSVSQPAPVGASV